MERFYRVVELFTSIDGEGSRAGRLVQFVRLAGCNLRCEYCDTLYALYGEKEECVYREMTADELLRELNQSIKRITLTGGEPLAHEGVSDLIGALSFAGYEVNVETNGAVPITPLLEAMPYSDVFYTVDYKLPSSGMESRMVMDNYFILRHSDVVKFVVGGDEDIEPMLSLVRRMREHYQTTEYMPLIYIGTVWNRFDARRIVELMAKEPVLHEAVFQLQMHKFIWEPDTRNV